jgi:hypothetical protein
MTVNNAVKRTWKNVGVVKLKEPYGHLPGETE